jgi:hypothetical protein
MMPTITISNLQPGDVLLYNSDNLIARLIRSFDDAEVSHAGLYLGDGQVGEALIVGNPGVNMNPLAKSCAGSNWVAAGRLREQQDTGLVLSVANHYLEQGNRYAYGQIFLLAAICLTRKLDHQNAIVRKIAERTLRGAAGIVAGWRQEDREPMICSEFVYRAYDEALPELEDPYSLEILSQSTRKPTRRFSFFRRRKGLFGAGSPPKSPVIHPDSLLARIQDEPARLDEPRLTAAAPTTEEDVESEVEQLAQEFFGESRTTAAPGDAVSATGDVDNQDVKSAAIEFARSIVEAAPSTDVGGEPLRYGSESSAEMSSVEQLTLIVADFVTPGDLHKSPSLRTIGKLSI